MQNSRAQDLVGGDGVAVLHHQPAHELAIGHAAILSHLAARRQEKGRPRGRPFSLRSANDHRLRRTTKALAAIRTAIAIRPISDRVGTATSKVVSKVPGSGPGPSPQVAAATLDRPGDGHPDPRAIAPGVGSLTESEGRPFSLSPGGRAGSCGSCAPAGDEHAWWSAQLSPKAVATWWSPRREARWSPSQPAHQKTCAAAASRLAREAPPMWDPRT